MTRALFLAWRPAIRRVFLPTACGYWQHNGAVTQAQPWAKAGRCRTHQTSPAPSGEEPEILMSPPQHPALTWVIGLSGKKEYEVDEPVRMSNTKGLSGSATILWEHREPSGAQEPPGAQGHEPQGFPPSPPFSTALSAVTRECDCLPHDPPLHPLEAPRVKAASPAALGFSLLTHPTPRKRMGFRDDFPTMVGALSRFSVSATMSVCCRG